MASLVLSTKSLTGGVSQQPAPLRFPNQCELQENADATIVAALNKRAPLEHVKQLVTPLTGSQKVHIINRDPAERYVVVVGDAALKVYDIDGNAVTVTAQGGDFSYLDCTDPATQIKLLTIADYTLILNTTKVVGKHADTTTQRNPEALIFARQGNYGTEYKVTIKWTQGTARTMNVIKWTYHSNGAKADQGPSGPTAGGGTQSVREAELDIRTDGINSGVNDGAGIARALQDGLTAAPASIIGWGVIRSGNWGDQPLPSDFTVTRVGSTIRITLDPNGPNSITDFEVEVNDSVASGNLISVKDVVETFTVLPTVAHGGYRVQVKGDPEQTGFSGYWVIFVVDDGSNFGDGRWEESTAPGIQYKFDRTSMPHVLVRQSDGTFYFSKADGSNPPDFPNTPALEDWGERTVGDDTTNPFPSFTGQTIRDMAFFKNRLVFLSSDSVVLSEAGQYFNFWRTTVTDLLDAERIDSEAVHNKIAALQHAVPSGEQVLLFAEGTQFVLRGEELLTPKTISILPTTEHDAYRDLTPVVRGRSVFFSARRGGASLVKEMLDVTQVRPAFEAAEITAHVPTYVQGQVLEIKSSGVDELLLLRTDDDLGALYAYRSFTNGEERIQSAWSKWTFSGSLRGGGFIDHVLYLVVERGTKVSLEKLDLETFKADSDSAFLFLLDRRIKESQLVSAVYNPTNDETTLTLPYDVAAGATMEVWTRATATEAEGTFIPIKSSTATTLVVAGDHSTTPLWVGERYLMRYVFSPIHLQSEGPSGRAAVVSGRFQVRRGSILYADSGHFKVLISPKGSQQFEARFDGPGIGLGASVGEVNLDSGALEFSVFARSNEVTIEVQNDSPFPSRLLAAEWEGESVLRGRRVA